MAKKNDEMTDTVCDNQVQYMVFGLIVAIGELTVSVPPDKRKNV